MKYVFIGAKTKITPKIKAKIPNSIASLPPWFPKNQR